MKHTLANGIVIINIYISIPINHHERPIIMPPNINHRIFPTVLIIIEKLMLILKNTI